MNFSAESLCESLRERPERERRKRQGVYDMWDRISGLFGVSNSVQARRFPKRARLNLTELESRCTTATFTVNTITDTPDVDINDGAARDQFGNTSLRAAIQHGNFTAGADLINFTGIPAGSTLQLGIPLPPITSELSIEGQGRKYGDHSSRRGRELRHLPSRAERRRLHPLPRDHEWTRRASARRRRGLQRGEQVKFRSQGVGSLFASSSDAYYREAHKSFILSGGNLHLTEGTHVVVVCDGDFFADRLLGSIVIARGSVQVWSQVGGSVILAGGDVRVVQRRSINSSLIRAGGAIRTPEQAAPPGCNFKAGQKDVFRQISVRFFDPASVGVAVEPSRFAVRVSRSEQAFARAGLREGDLITEFDGVEVRTPEAFRRLLRKRIVLEGEAELRVRRDGKTLSLRVRLD